MRIKDKGKRQSYTAAWVTVTTLLSLLLGGGGKCKSRLQPLYDFYIVQYLDLTIRAKLMRYLQTRSTGRIYERIVGRIASTLQN